ncbi:MAG: hypothetical protein J0H88_24455, partial [Sphingomonadales bacterium]|nr:hypothetical protein [Sphingomonadales bacterium]
TREQVLAHVQKHDATLLDVRPQNFYLGQFKAPMALMAGTIPTAIDQDFTRWVQNGSANAVPTEEARKLAAEIKRPEGQDLVLFCNTGVWSALVWFEMHSTMETAIAREKQIKAGNRARKIALIETENPFWQDLWPRIIDGSE